MFLLITRTSIKLELWGKQSDSEQSPQGMYAPPFNKRTVAISELNRTQNQGSSLDAPSRNLCLKLGAMHSDNFSTTFGGAGVNITFRQGSSNPWPGQKIAYVI